MRVAFRTDASAQIGTGHLRRCLSLARALNELQVKTIFVCRLHDPVAAQIREQGQRHFFLQQPGSNWRPPPGGPTHAVWAGVDWLTDTRDFVNAVGDLRPDWVVVDHYAFDARWHSEVRRALGCKIAVIDDLGDRSLELDILIDQNLQPAQGSKYQAQLSHDAVALLGPRYALLDKAYESAPRYEFREQVTSIGIFMGGSDLADLGSLALRACREVAGFSGTIEIVTSRSAPHFAEQAALAERTPRTRLLSDLPHLAAFFARHDLQIGCGGSASWERCCIGVPTLAIMAAVNQEMVLPALAAAGAVEALQGVPPPQALGIAIAALIRDAARRAQMARAGCELVDGRGSARVALEIKTRTLTT